ncbi:hypothetical protein ACH4C6_07725 [Streptomyces sp. NPDC017943]|uniref:hypothetical protein n=1 Tax=Streptomyces sp. NPDC017943 TaxID=3365019 RepID=UPI00379F1346
MGATPEGRTAEAFRQAVPVFGGVDLAVGDAGPSMSESLPGASAADRDPARAHPGADAARTAGRDRAVVCRTARPAAPDGLSPGPADRNYAAHVR